jgi:hypothetical protein
MSERTLAFNIIINKLFKLFSSSIFPLFNYTKTTIYKRTILLASIILHPTLLHKLTLITRVRSLIKYQTRWVFQRVNFHMICTFRVEQELGAKRCLLFVPTRLKPTLIIFFIFLPHFFWKVLQSVSIFSILVFIPLRIPVEVGYKLVSFPLQKWEKHECHF